MREFGPRTGVRIPVESSTLKKVIFRVTKGWIQEFLGRGINPPGGAPTFFLKFSQKLHEIKKFLGCSRGTYWGCPPPHLNLSMERNVQRRMQDFPKGGTNSPGGRQHTILPNFPENCMNQKEFGRPGGCTPLAAPKSATDVEDRRLHKIQVSNWRIVWREFFMGAE